MRCAASHLRCHGFSRDMCGDWAPRMRGTRGVGGRACFVCRQFHMCYVAEGPGRCFQVDRPYLFVGCRVAHLP